MFRSPPPLLPRPRAQQNQGRSRSELFLQLGQLFLSRSELFLQLGQMSGRTQIAIQA